RSRSTSESVAFAGRETPDGAIDVEDVDETMYNQASQRTRRPGDIVSQMYNSDNDTDDDFHYGGEEEEDEDDDNMFDSVEIDEMADEDDEMQNSIMFLQHQGVSLPRRRGRNHTELAGSGADFYNTRGRRARGAYIFPFHPGLIQHGLIQRGGGGGAGSGRFNPLDYYANDDIDSLLSFLDATTPAPPPSRPLSPLEPIKLTANQEKLAASDEYSRQVPQANFRDNVHTSTGDDMEIVCTQCTGSLFEKEAIWAPKCGHIMCNQCVEGITGATKTCTACKKRIAKKTLVHVYA
ncbi:hypothetical protein LPJ74_004133, partial [Coemansia sp. RSA 1843]